jgi:tetratricopeptide (TPR) repeat protein
VFSAAHLSSVGQHKELNRIIELLETERERIGPMLVGRIETLRAHVARADGRPADYAQGFQRATEFFEHAGHRRAATEALGNAGLSLMELGQLEAAESHMRRLWTIVERMGLNHLLGGTLYSLANILAYRGELEEARTLGEKALTWTAENNDQYFRSYTLLYLSVTDYLLGDYTVAESRARDALQILEGNPSLRPFALALLARSLLRQGQTDRALEKSREAFIQLETLVQVDDGEATIRLAFAECCAASGDDLTANKVLRSASDWLSKRAGTIGNSEWRRSFLTRIPEHLSILKLARERGIVFPNELAD